MKMMNARDEDEADRLDTRDLSNQFTTRDLRNQRLVSFRFGSALGGIAGQQP